MTVKVIRKDNNEIYRTLYAVRVATRISTINKNETEFVVYSGGHGFAFSERFYDIVIEA